jgi:streptogramin lyase
MNLSPRRYTLQSAFNHVVLWALLPLLLLGGMNRTAGAQTAQAGGMVTLGSGFSYPYSVAVDGSGNVFVADAANNAVKEIVAAGGYTTVNTLGSGFSNPDGVAVDGSGNVFVADYGNNAVREIVAAGGYTTVNTLGSGFNYPLGVAVDGSGNVYVADTNSNAVKEIVEVGGYTTVNTLGSGFSSPHRRGGRRERQRLRCRLCQ